MSHTKHWPPIALGEPPKRLRYETLINSIFHRGAGELFPDHLQSFSGIAPIPFTEAESEITREQ
jgi:hypothetical protein